MNYAQLELRLIFLILCAIFLMNNAYANHHLPLLWVAPKENSFLESSSAKAATLTTHNLLSFPPNTILPIPIKTGLRVESIEKIDDADKSFSAKIKLRLKWHDARLSFDAWENGGNVRLFVDEEAKTQLSKIWQPEIKIINLSSDKDFIDFIGRGTGLILHSTGDVEFIQDFFATFKIPFDLTEFPFDTQLLKIMLLSPKYGMNKVILISDQADIDFSGLAQEVKLAKWQFAPLEFEQSQTRGWEGLLRSKLTIQWNANRDPTGYLNNIFMPLFLIFCTNYLLVIYLSRENLETNITIISSSLLAMIALDFSVSITYPALETNSMIDKMFMVGYAYSWLLLGIALTLLNPHFTRKIASRYTILESIAFLKWSAPLLLLLVLMRVFI